MVRTKKRRIIVCGGKKYVWYILTGNRDYWEYMSGDNWETAFLHIISADKTLILTVPLSAPNPYAVSKGSFFQGRPSCGRWERYLLPFAIPRAVTPKTVFEIIEWAVNGENAEGVKWNGREYRV